MWTPVPAPIRPSRSRQRQRKPAPRSSKRRRSSACFSLSWLLQRPSDQPQPGLAPINPEGRQRHGNRHMKDFFICNRAQQENKITTSSFVVIAKQVKPKNAGDPYLALTRGDRTGQIEAKMWDNVADAIDVFDQD